MTLAEFTQLTQSTKIPIGKDWELVLLDSNGDIVSSNWFWWDGKPFHRTSYNGIVYEIQSCDVKAKKLTFREVASENLETSDSPSKHLKDS